MGWEAVTDVGRSIADPLTTFANSVISVLPSVIGAILFATLGYIVAKLIGLLVKKALLKVGLDRWYESTGKHAALGHMSLSYLVGGMTKWYLFALFLVPSVSILQLDTFAVLLTQIALWIPKLLLAILVVLAGIIIADIAADKLAHAKKIGWIRSLTPPIKFVIILFFLDVALRQIGIDFSLASSTFLILLGGLTLALSIAVGLSFGFALRPEVANAIKTFKKKFD